MNLSERPNSSKIYFADKESLLDLSVKFNGKIKHLDTSKAPVGSLEEYEQVKKNDFFKWKIDSNGIVHYPINGGFTADSDLFYYFYDYETPYQFIESDFKQFKNDRYVKGVIIDMNSPGGEANGYVDALKSIENLGKPVIVHSRAWTMSMAYQFACAANAIFASEGSRIGSIGSIWEHWNIHKALTDQGIEPITIRDGEDKGKPNDSEAVTTANYARMAEWVKEEGTKFKNYVASKRNLSLETDENGLIPWAEGRHFSPEDALNLGLIDGIKNRDEAYKYLVSLIDTGPRSGSQASNQSVSQTMVKNMYTQEQMNEKINEINSLKASNQELKDKLEAKEKAEKTNLITQIGEFRKLSALDKTILEKCSNEELSAVLSEAKAEQKEEEKPAEQPQEEPKEEPKEEPAQEPAAKKVFVGAVQAAEQPQEKAKLSSVFYNVLNS